MTEKDGAIRAQRYLGPADDPDALRQANDIRRAAADARTRRTTVSMLKRSGIPAPPLDMGRLMEAIANAGLFRNGVVLVGTGAYQVYSAVVGAALAHGTLTTQDADLALVTLAVASEPEGQRLLDILQRADPTFAAQMGLDPREPPRRFRSAAGFEVDVITRYRRRSADERAVRMPALQCAARPWRHVEFLIGDPIMAVALHGSGVQVTIPQPARYAVHKLVLAQVRGDTSTKRAKDLAQAKELIDALRLSDPHAVDDALADARRRGTKWKTNVDRSLRELGLDGAWLV